MLRLTLILVFTCVLTTHAEDVLESIRQREMARIAVLPRAVTRSSFRANAEFDATIGPQADYAAQQMYDRLVNAFGKSIIPQEEVLKALNDVTADELTSAKELSAIGRELKADGLVTLLVTDSEQHYFTTEKLYDLRDEAKVSGSEAESPVGPVHSSSAKVEKTLSDAAYEGQSFEVRRWQDGKLLASGLEDIDGDGEFGWGVEYEKLQFARLRLQKKHPLEVPGFPYRFRVMVDAQERKPVRIGERLYVQIDPGEEFVLEVENNSGQSVFMGIWVDGVNVYGKQLEHPLETPTCRTWILTDGRNGLVPGWHDLDPANKAVKVNRFAVDEFANAVAVRKGAGDKVGVITSIVYTDGMNGFPHPSGPIPPRSIDNPIWGVGEGIEEAPQVKYRRGTKGIMLAAISVFYRSAAEIDVPEVPPPPVVPKRSGRPNDEATPFTRGQPSDASDKPDEATPFTPEQSTGSGGKPDEATPFVPNMIGD